MALASGCRYRYEIQAGVSGDSTDSSSAGTDASGGVSSAGASPALLGGAGGQSGGRLGLVGYWPFDEGSGQLAVDASGNGNDGTLLGVGLAWEAGQLNGALTFPDGAYVRVEPSASIDSIAQNDELTMAAWVWLDRSVGWQTVLSQQFEGSSDETFSLTTRASQVVAIINRGNVKECYGPSPVALRQWVHLASTFDGTTARLYVNGVEDCSFLPDLKDVPVSGNPLLIGANVNLITVDQTVNEFMIGKLDEVVLYNRALSATEIGKLQTGQLP